MGSLIDSEFTRGSDAEILGASRDQARRIGGSLKEKALTAADSHKGQLVDGLHKLATSLEQQGGEGTAGQLFGIALSAAERAASTLEGSTAEQLLEQGSQRVKARPALFIAGCLGLGFLGARLLRK